MFKQQTVIDLVDIFPQWRQSKQTLEEDVALEIHDAARGYLDAYYKFVARIGKGDYQALFDSPVVSMFVQDMLRYLPHELPPAAMLQKCGEFFRSEHFASIPFHDIEAKRLRHTKSNGKKRGLH